MVRPRWLNSHELRVDSLRMNGLRLDGMSTQQE
jgi:hypothetical protein